jgi:catalase (peroxidase I)
MNKFDLMRLTGLDHGVDSALPQHWLDKMAQMGLNYSNALFWYAWQYQKSPSGPIHLGEELLNTMEETQIHLTNGGNISILDLVKTLLDHPDNVMIRVM